MGWSTCTDDHPLGCVTPAVQASYLTRAYELIEQDPYVQVAIWYSLRNIGADGPSWLDQLGLFTQRTSRQARRGRLSRLSPPPGPGRGAAARITASLARRHRRLGAATTSTVLHARRVARRGAQRLVTRRLSGRVTGATAGIVSLLHPAPPRRRLVPHLEARASHAVAHRGVLPARGPPARPPLSRMGVVRRDVAGRFLVLALRRLPHAALSEVLVVCYHGVSPSWGSPYSIAPARLRAQIASLLHRGYHPATLSQAIASPPGDRTLVVTFDDALSSVRTHALPVLQALGVPATVFACTAWAGRDDPIRIGADRWIGGPHERELVSLDWDDLAVLRDAGWQIGSHTRTHPRLTRVSDAELRRELAHSKGEIEERLGLECSRARLSARGCRRTCRRGGPRRRVCRRVPRRGGVGAPDPLRWPRSVVLREDGRARFRVKTSRTARRLRGSRTAWKVLAPGYKRSRDGAGAGVTGESRRIVRNAGARTRFAGCSC